MRLAPALTWESASLVAAPANCPPSSVAVCWAWPATPLAFSVRSFAMSFTSSVTAPPACRDDEYRSPEVVVEAGWLPEASAPCPTGFDGVLSNDAILLSCPTVDGVLQQRT